MQSCTIASLKNKCIKTFRMEESKGIKCLHLQILVLNTRIVNGGFYI